MNQPQPSVAVFKESHRLVARMFAAGWTLKEIQARTGYSRRRLNILYSTPAFQQLIADVEPDLIETLARENDEFAALMREAGLIAARQRVDKLHEADDRGEYLPMRELNSLVADFADRFGYSKHTRVSHDHSFADLLDRAIERSGTAKLINGEATRLPEPPKQIPVSSSEEPAAKVPVTRTLASALKGQKPGFRRV